MENLAAIFTIASELLDSDTDEEMDTILINYGVKRKRKRLAIENYVSNVALRYTLDDFKSHFRLRRDTFEQLLHILAPKLKATRNVTGVGRPCEAVEIQLLITLCMLSNQEVFRSISERYDVAKSTVWEYVHKICAVLVTLSENYITWPIGAQVAKTMSEFEIRQGVVNVIGAIDGTHIPITPPARQQRAYFNRNKYHSIVLQSVCNAKYRFTDVFAGFPGSKHDARVLWNSDLGKKVEKNAEALFPRNSHILADSAYQNTNLILTPFRDNGRLIQIQREYNFKHSSTPVYIEQTFGLLKDRFRILKHVPIYRTELIPPLVLACCVLHNICMQNNDTVEPDTKAKEFSEIPYNGHANTGLNKRNAIANMLYIHNNNQ